MVKINVSKFIIFQNFMRPCRKSLKQADRCVEIPATAVSHILLSPHTLKRAIIVSKHGNKEIKFWTKSLVWIWIFAIDWCTNWNCSNLFGWFSTDFIWYILTKDSPFNYDIDVLFDNCDRTFFRSSLYITHCLHHLLPGKRDHTHAMTLRPHGHNYSLPRIKFLNTRISFINRSLYKYV